MFAHLVMTDAEGKMIPVVSGITSARAALDEANFWGRRWRPLTVICACGWTPIEPVGNQCSECPEVARANQGIEHKARAWEIDRKVIGQSPYGWEPVYVAFTEREANVFAHEASDHYAEVRVTPPGCFPAAS